MRARTPAVLAVTAALTLTACGGEGDTEPAGATVDASSEMTDEMTGEMTDGERTTSDALTDEMSDEMSDEMTGEMSDEMTDDVLMTAMQRDDLTTFVAAVEAAGLGGTLRGSGPYTIFAPSNDAFLDYLGEMGMTADEALADGAALRALLEHHVVEGDDDAEMVMGMAGQSFTTLAGGELQVTVDGDIVMVGDATILRYDLHATNGIVHVVDRVLVP